MKALSPFVRHGWLAALLVFALCSSAKAMFAFPQPTPIDRLLQSAEDFKARYPQKAEGYYTLGRIHYLAFHLKQYQIPAFTYHGTKPSPPYLPPQWMIGSGENLHSGKSLDSKELVTHAAAALHHFQEAARLSDGDSGLIHLGIASLEEEFLAWNQEAKVADLPPELQGITLTGIRAEYAQALTAAMVADGKLTERPPSGLDGITSYEAATALVRLAEKSGELTEAEKKDVKRAKDALRFFKGLRMGPITPIVFSFRAVDHLEELLAPEITVDFDLRGCGPRERWPWVRPDLGLLVWDPMHTGRIESARQLFGGYTFEIFRANGYDALAALDANGDGVLSEAELEGISVWFDRNGDGISTPDEVTPVQDLGIVAIAVTTGGYDGIHPTNASGITLRDGRTLRTWDWIAEPVSRAAAPLVSAGQR